MVSHLLKDGLQKRGLHIFAVVRTPEQAKQVEAWGVGIEPLSLNLGNYDEVKQMIMDKNSALVLSVRVSESLLTLRTVPSKVEIVLHGANPLDPGPPKAFIDGLAARKAESSKEVHFIHVRDYRPLCAVCCVAEH